VEQIRSHRTWGRSRTLQYLIKWKGYPESDNTWENVDQIHAPELIKLYHQALVKRSIRIRRLRLRRGRSRSILSPHFCIIRPCPPTTSFSSIVNTAYSSPLNLAGPTTIGTSAYTSHDTTASSVPSRSGPETISRPTLSINTRPTLRRDNDWTSPRRFPHFGTLGCTPATFLPSVVKAVNTPPPHSANSTSTVSFVNYPDDTGVPSARKCSPPLSFKHEFHPSVVHRFK
jgi:Chromo (CHRromatin Organisation MOdifier) domain